MRRRTGPTAALAGVIASRIMARRAVDRVRSLVLDEGRPCVSQSSAKRRLEYSLSRFGLARILKKILCADIHEVVPLSFCAGLPEIDLAIGHRRLRLMSIR